MTSKRHLPPTSARTKVSSRWVVLLAGLGILFCTGGPSYYVAEHLTHPPGTWQSWMYVYPFTAVAIGGGVALGSRLVWMPIRRWPWPTFAIGAYAIWALCSVLWTVSPLSTPEAALIGLGIVAFGCWFGWCLRIDDQIWAVVVATAISSVASAIVVAWRPLYGKMYLAIGFTQGGEPWQGIYGNRNSLAPVCVLGLIALAGLVVRAPSLRRIAFAAPLGVLHFILLRNSGGMTSMVALVLVALTALFVPTMRWIRRSGVPGPGVATALIAMAIGGWLFVFDNLERISSRIGGDITFDGRRAMWADVRSFIRVHPVRGYGFWGFWDRADLTADTYARLGAYGSAHNSVLEVTLMLGFVGLVFYLIICGAAIAGPLVWSWRRPSVAAWWWCLVMVFLVAENLTESFVLWHSYIWVLFLAAALAPFGPSARADPMDAVEATDMPTAIDDVDATQPAPRNDIDDVWSNSATSIAELLPTGDIDN